MCVRSGLCGMCVCVKCTHMHTQDAVSRDNFEASRLSQDYQRTLTFLHKNKKHELFNCKIIEKHFRMMVFGIVK